MEDMAKTGDYWFTSKMLFSNIFNQIFCAGILKNTQKFQKMKEKKIVIFHTKLFFLGNYFASKGCSWLKPAKNLFYLLLLIERLLTIIDLIFELFAECCCTYKHRKFNTNGQVP